MITSLDVETVSFLLRYCKQHKIPNKFTLASTLLYNNKKYGTSTNDYYNINPLAKKYNYYNNHAEIATLFKSSKLLNVTKFRSSSLVIAGVGRSNNCNILKSSYPCKYCYNVITNFNCGRLVYITSRDNKYLKINEEILNGRK
jgi:tRNA(Arg) A34 adenosine deaminase TadA